MNQMERNEREYQQAMDALRFSGEAKARMAASLTTEREERPVKAKRFRPLRTGLLAACMCLALVGTAFAAVYQLTVQISSDEEHVRYIVYGEAVKHPLEDYSPEMQADYAAFDRSKGGILPGRKFDGWDGAKAYLGDNIPCVWRNTDDVVWDGEYRVQMIPDLTWDTNDLQYAHFYNNALLDCGMSCETMIYIYGPRHTYDQLYGMGQFLGAEYRLLEDYAMANGCVAKIILESGAEDWPTQYSIGIFMKEGMLYKVSLYGGAAGQFTDEEMVTQLCQVLDSFY